MGKFADELAPKFADAHRQTLADFKAMTVAWVIQRFIEAMDGADGRQGLKPLGESHRCTLRVIQRGKLGSIDAKKLADDDVIGYCEDLRNRPMKPLGPATVNQYITYLRGALNFAGSRWKDCKGITAAAIDVARPVLVKYNLIGKSIPRKRRPTTDELDRLMAYFNEQAKRKRTKIRMPDIVLFALASTRRRGEICRIQHGDIDWDRKDEKGNPTPMYMVRDLKHPKLKKGNHKWFPLFAELAEIIRIQPRTNPADPAERVFPFNPKSVTKRYIEAKHALGITNLRFHDNRREAITRWLAILKNPHKVKLISGHETTHILERVYDATDPATLHGDVRQGVQP